MAGIFDRLDPDQGAAVRLRANATVSAGAGSGKTTVLAARYLDLLFSSKAELRSILCLTFTR
ncbi:MAG: UvrD-helicase domain-containing protein, partial [Rectinemataceae bacterium]